jgi:hypothetical protein
MQIFENEHENHIKTRIIDSNKSSDFDRAIRVNIV